MASYTTVADCHDVEDCYVVGVTIRKTEGNSTRVDGITASALRDWR
jgi:hypothetical protein